jgi:hypothetical protein
MISGTKPSLMGKGTPDTTDHKKSQDISIRKQNLGVSADVKGLHYVNLCQNSRSRDVNISNHKFCLLVEVSVL